MANQERSNFAVARKELERAAREHPDWFYVANAVLARTNDGKVTLQQAVLEALAKAWEDGRRGIAPPAAPPSQFATREQQRNAWKGEPEQVAAPKVVRRGRSPAPQVQEAKPKRVIRSAR